MRIAFIYTLLADPLVHRFIFFHAAAHAGEGIVIYRYNVLYNETFTNYYLLDDLLDDDDDDDEEDDDESSSPSGIADG